MNRRRADAVLYERGFFESRERAKAAILAGEVRVDGALVTKAGAQIDPLASVEVAERPRFVSRGGEKLAGALDEFAIDPEGLRVVDVGASTGGFTDCLLQRGARSAVCVDVGYGQLAWALRQNERVTLYERTNIRDVDPRKVGAPFDLVVVDVSFISLRTVLPHLVALMGDDGEIIALVKPQFEAGKGRIGKKGVVRDPAVHGSVLREVIEAVKGEGLVVRGITWSRLRGPEGNIEFWVRATRGGDPVDIAVDDVVTMAHAAIGE